MKVGKFRCFGLCVSLLLAAHAARAAEGAGDGKQGLQDEVVVIGTYIRGNQPASPVLVFDREDFDRAGAATTEQFLETLPQNFGGGAREDTTKDPFGETNLTFASGVNLRGLGSSATLVLIDGRRSAASGLAEFVDVSMIPLSAVERIEIMTDGASALYGADAVGGVVNFIMRRDFDGAETRARYGSPTRGGAEEVQASQSLGFGWERGGILVSADYYDRNSLSSQDRSFSRDTASPLDGPRDLVPVQTRESAFLNAQQDLGSRVRLSGSALYSEREADYTDWDTGGAAFQLTTAESKQSAASLGSRIGLGGSWEANLAGGLSQQEMTVYSPAIGVTNRVDYDLWSADATAYGTLFDLPKGHVKAALGVSYRDESFQLLTTGPSGILDAPPQGGYYSRAAFAEVLVPILRSQSASEAQLQLSLAGRYEEYSSFGTSFDPKYGLRWTPVSGLSLRATYGTSFKAPNAWQLDESLAGRSLSSILDPTSPTGRTRSLVRQGRNAELGPESATILTAGIELAPQWLSGFTTELTWFDIDYEDRITAPAVVPALMLNDPVYAQTVLRRGEVPDAEFDALVAALFGTQPVIGCNPRNLAGPCAEPVSNVRAIVDRRLRNFAGTRTRGMDWSLAQQLDSGLGRFTFDLNASYLFENAQQVSTAAPFVNMLNRVRSPTDFRARAGASLAAGGLNLSTFVNYIDNYDNEGVINLGTRVAMPAATIDSWTTVDLNIAWDTGNRSSEWISDLRMLLSVRNALDEDPPAYEDGAWGYGYDPANADPLGRVISLTVAKAW